VTEVLVFQSYLGEQVTTIPQPVIRRIGIRRARSALPFRALFKAICLELDQASEPARSVTLVSWRDATKATALPLPNA